MATTALTKITARAKKIRKEHPKMAWSAAIKKAGAEYRNGTIKGAPKKKAAPKKKSARKKVGGVVAGGGVAAPLGTLVGNINNAKKILSGRIGRMEAQKTTAKTKRDKTKIGKEIAAEKIKLRKLSNI